MAQTRAAIAFDATIETPTRDPGPGPAGLAEHFAWLAYTHRREYVQWVMAAKKLETRAKRVAKALTMLRHRSTLS
ncbi:MAG TPA: YdeI/OmpD-associated family protein [Acidimicrobiales bacterium]